MSGETILVVDDGRDNRDFIVQYVLDPNGFKALTAVDGQEGLEMALKQRPDLILLDLQMPRMDGIDVLKNLAAQNADIPVILMTFHGSEDIAIEVYRMGVKDYVKKPYTVEEMYGAIERSLSETRLRREKEALTKRVIQANRELKRRLEELNVLYNVGKSVTSLVDLDQLLPRIVDAATQITQAQEGFLFLQTEDGMMCRAIKRNNMGHAEATNTQATDPIVGHVMKNGQPLVLTPEQMQDAPVENGPITASYAPLVLGGRAMGVLGVANVTAKTHIFTQHDGALLSALTDYAAIAIENSRNYTALLTSKEAEKATIRDTFERFVPPSVVAKVLDEHQEARLGGQRQEISVLFADISGYSTWSDGARPEEVIETLNHYLSLAAEVVMGWGGTLDKYLGDGLMAVFNAPEAQPDHVHRVADTALALMRAADEVAQQYGHPLTYSIGVHVGLAVVGYIGTERALNYTAVGDTVNLTKRLQEHAAPGQILISEEIYKRLGDQSKCHPLGSIKVKGHKDPMPVYELQDLK